MNTQPASSRIVAAPRPAQAELAPGPSRPGGDGAADPADQGFAAQLAAHGNPRARSDIEPAATPPAGAPVASAEFAVAIADTVLPQPGKDLPPGLPLLPPGLVNDLSEPAALPAALHQPTIVQLPPRAMAAVQAVSTEVAKKIAKAAAGEEQMDDAEPATANPSESALLVAALQRAPAASLPAAAPVVAAAAAQPQQTAPAEVSPSSLVGQPPARDKPAASTLATDNAPAAPRHSVETIAALAAQRGEPTQIEPAGSVGVTAPSPTAVTSPVMSAPSAPGSAPADLAQVIEAIARARAQAQPQSVHLAVRHAEFGPVSLHFQQDGAGLSVAMTSPDPDFARAVSAAVPVERSGAGGGDNAASQQRSAANTNAGSESHTDTNSQRSGESGSGESGSRQQPGTARSNPPVRGNSDDQTRNGIFA